MRECQTGGDYTAVSEEGTNYGAYQFRIATWDELAGREYPSLVGVVPSEASPADQDRMAYALWQEFGSSRWPGCRSTIDPHLLRRPRLPQLLNRTLPRRPRLPQQR